MKIDKTQEACSAVLSTDGLAGNVTTEKDMSELKPCPFCGGEARQTAHLEYSWFAPVCRSCGVRGPSVRIERGSAPQKLRELMNKADELWNNRVPAQAGRAVDPMSRIVDLACRCGFGGQLRNTHAVKLEAFYREAWKDALLAAADHFEGRIIVSADLRRMGTLPPYPPPKKP